MKAPFQSAAGSAPAEQTVTIRNTGNQPVTLTQPVDTASFTVGALSSAELAVGQTAAFTVRPKTGLAPGTYSETLALSGQSGTYSVGTDVALRFVVEQRDDGQEGGGSSGGGSSSGGGGAATYSATVAAADHGTVTVSPKNAAKGSTVTITVTPKAGYELDELTVTDSKGSEINVRSAGSNKYTFEMPGSRVTVSASFARTGESGSDMPFTDVSAGAYYFDAFRWAAEEGITSGVTGTTFAPGHLVGGGERYHQRHHRRHLRPRPELHPGPDHHLPVACQRFSPCGEHEEPLHRRERRCLLL